MITIPAEWWTLLVGTVLPALVALVQARYSSSKWGAFLLLALSAVSAVALELIVSGDGSVTFSWADVGQRFVILFVTAVVAHFGFLRAFGVTGHEGAIQRAVPKGIGSPAAYVPQHSRTVYSSDTKPDAAYYDGTGQGPGGGG